MGSLLSVHGINAAVGSLKHVWQRISWRIIGELPPQHPTHRLFWEERSATRAATLPRSFQTFYNTDYELYASNDSSNVGSDGEEADAPPRKLSEPRQMSQKLQGVGVTFRTASAMFHATEPNRSMAFQVSNGSSVPPFRSSESCGRRHHRLSF